MEYNIRPVGDSAITIEFGREIDPEISALVRAARKDIGRAKIPGVVELVQTYATLMVHYNSLEVDYKTLVAEVKEQIEKIDLNDGRMKKKTIEIPVC